MKPLAGRTGLLHLHACLPLYDAANLGQKK